MKKQTKLILVISIPIFIIVALLITLVATGTLKISQATGYTTQSQVIGKLYWGTISCDPLSPPSQSLQGSYPINNNQNIPATAFNQGSISDFQATIITPSINNIASFGGNPKYRAIYSICNLDGSSCSPKDAPIVTCNPSISYPYYLNCPSATNTLQSVNQNQFLTVSWESTNCNSASTFLNCKHDTIDGWTYEKGATYTIVYHPYGLVQHDALSGGVVPLSPTCSGVQQLAIQKGEKLVTDSNYIKMNEFKDTTTNSLLPNQAWNYINNIVLTIVNTETYNGNEAVCQDRTMYGLSSISTTDGSTYKVVDTSKNYGTVSCCNGEANGALLCVNHNFVSTSTQASCSITQPCPLSSWNPDTSDSSGKTIFRQTCVNSVCQKVTQTVECTSANQCNTGYECSNYKCVQTTVPPPIPPTPQNCGDGICGIGENATNCPLDCHGLSLSCKEKRDLEISSASPLTRPLVAFTSWFSYAWCSIVEFFNSLANIFISALALIIFLTTAFTVPSNTKKLVPNNTARIILGILIGLILVALCFIFKWVIIITLIIIGIIWLIIKALL